MLKPIERIEAVAQEVGRTVELFGYALDGLFEQSVRGNPSVQGIQLFYQQAGGMMEEFTHQALNKIAHGHEALEASLSDSERTFLAEHTSSDLERSDAVEAFWGAMQQVRAQYTKRLREIIAARAFGTDTYNADPKVMTRSGRRWNFVEYGYLTARRLLVDRYNEIKIGYIVSIGGDSFVLDDGSEEHFYVENYPIIADDLFHPRTTKLVGGIYVST